MSLLAGMAEKVNGPGLRMLEFFGIIKEGSADALREFAGGMGAVADEFRDRFTTNIHEAADAATALAGAATDAGDQSEAGLGKAAAASDAMSAASKDLAAAAEQGKAALEGAGFTIPFPQRQLRYVGPPIAPTGNDDKSAA
jgi:hypothetical protein